MKGTEQIIVLIAVSCAMSLVATAAEPSKSTNPTLQKGQATVDGKVGAFRQRDSFDCFFLAVLIAIANDSDGIKILNSIFGRKTERRLERQVS